MDELEISGKRYISSRRAAKEHKYHTDYIGQLIRGGKVDGQKVGRAWYVNEDSLRAYLQKEPKEAGSPKVVEMPVAAAAEAAPAPTPEPTVSEEEGGNEDPEDAGEEDVPHHVVIHVEDESEPEEVAAPVVQEKKKKIFLQPKEKPNLVYLTDDEPMLPHLSKPEPEIVVPATPNEPPHLVGAADAEEIKKEKTRTSSRVQNVMRVAALAGVGLFIFATIVGASSVLTTRLVVEEGKPASVGISFQ